jgi:3-oxoacyl-[acyl-carrier protein] reductase
MRLTNRSAIVTGAARGIGRAIALRLASEGCRVAVDDIDTRGGSETAKFITDRGGQAIFVPADVSRPEDVQHLVATAEKSFGATTILVNSAICGLQAIVGNEFEPNVEVVLHGAWLCIQAVLPGMKTAGGGSIVNISSVNAFMGFGRAHVYSAIKAGIIGMSRSLCCELGADNIRINCVCPGTVLTEIWQERVEKDPGIVDRLARLYPLGRLGRPEEIANATLFLASEESSFMTGSVMVVDGGLTAANTGFGGLSSKPPQA